MKGNTKANMAFIRSERNALDRLFAGEMPQGVEIIDEEYANEASFQLAEGEEGRAGRARGEEKPRRRTARPSEPKTKTQKSAGAPPAQAEKEGFHIDPAWLDDALAELKWSEATVKTFLASKYGVDTKGTLTDTLKRLTRQQAEEFTKEIQDKTSAKQAELWD